MKGRMDIALLLVALLTPPASCQPPAPGGATSLHERETTVAWKAYQQGQFDEAIRHADKCIDEFFGDARRRQQALTDGGAKVPLGPVTAEQKESVHKNGTLNDVATCHYIKGMASAKLGKRDVARSELEKATKLPSGRAWDERGWFWSPAEAAQLFIDHPEIADKPPHGVYTFLAWEDFNRGAYQEAIAHATRCVKDFQNIAVAMQQKLASQGVRLPVGAVSSSTKAQIDENGVLNDVATCLFIIGKSAEGRGDVQAAVQAYGGAVKLSYGRSWDPQGWFWSPAEACSDRLELLR
jgi:tetratricopeptide (TPR) repeat protein